MLLLLVEMDVTLVAGEQDIMVVQEEHPHLMVCLLYTSPSPRDRG